MHELAYSEGWDEHFKKMNQDVQRKIWKKIQQLKELEGIRHLKKGLPYFVAEVGQYRICFKQENNIRRIDFAGNHKQYEKWYLSLMK